LAGPHEVTLKPEDVSLSEHLDLATARMTPRLVAALESESRFVRPPSWPPPALRPGDGVIFVGFPGEWRTARSWDEMEFRGLTSLALVHESSEDYYVCHLDPEYVEVTKVAGDVEEVVSDQMGGISGGPAFLVRSDVGELLVPRLCGVVREGGGSVLAPGHRLIYFTPLTTLRRDGTFFS